MSITHTQPLREETPQVPLTRTLHRLVLAIDRPLAVWQRRRQHREQLRHMPDYLLRDIGLTEADVYEETSKPFWRA